MSDYIMYHKDSCSVSLETLKLLKENGINSFLNDENVLGMDPVGGVELKVFESDKDVAEKILKK